MNTNLEQSVLLIFWLLLKVIDRGTITRWNKHILRCCQLTDIV